MYTRCMGCMEVFEESYQVCPHCGYVIGTEPEEAIHMEPGSILDDRYIVGKVLGYGSFGTTYLGWDQELQRKVAIKEYLPSEFSTRMPGQTCVTVFEGDKSEQFHSGLNKFIDESKRLAKFISEPGIVKIYGVVEENDTAYIIMEYLEGENLSKHMEKHGLYTEEEALSLMLPVMNSLIAVHNIGLLHRDIAPDNIFITKDGEVKLIDFGASRYATTSHSRSLTVIIKQGYSPEEQYRSRGDQGPYTDVYALAATMYKMVTGKTPPDAMERRAKYENESKDILTAPHKLVKGISHDFENALLNAMNVRIEDRTEDIPTFIHEITAEDPPVKRRYGKIKKIDIYTWPLWLKVLIPSILSCLVIIGALMLTGVIRFRILDPNDLKIDVIEVPNLLDETEEGAEKAKGDGLIFIQDAEIVDPKYDKEKKVKWQDPREGRKVLLNTIVHYAFGSNGENDIVETDEEIQFNFIGKDFEYAKKRLKKYGISEDHITKVEEPSEDKAKGVVLGCEPESILKSEIESEDFTIKITVSSGLPQFAMPSVVGKTLDDAKNIILNKYQLSIDKINQVETNEYREGTVIKQTPAENTSVSKGGNVTLDVAVKKQVTTEVATTETLTTTTEAPTTVFTTAPTTTAAPTTTTKPTTTALTTTTTESTTSAYVEVPNVIGKTEEEASNALFSAGFEYFSEGYDYSETVPKGCICGQTPLSQDSPVRRGTYAKITISKGRAPVVYFDANGGTVSLSSVKLNPVSTELSGGRYPALPIPKRKGYHFEGWYSSEIGGERVYQGSKALSESNHSLFAHWINECKVTFHFYGGDNITYLTLNELLRRVEYKQHPMCVDADGLNLVDDVGGVWGYIDFIRTLHGDDKEEVQNMREWVDSLGWSPRMNKPKKML